MTETVVVSNSHTPAWPANSSVAIVSRLARGVAWTTLGNFVAQGSSFLCAVIVARILGKSFYGQFAMILSTAVAITSVAGMGLGFTATKYVSEFRTSAPDRVGRILGLSSTMAMLTAAGFALGLVALEPAAVSGGGGSAVVNWGLRWSSIYVFFITLTGFQTGAMAGFESFGTIALVGTAYGVANVAVTSLLVRGHGLFGAVVAQGCGAFLLWLLYHFALRRECRSWGVEINWREAWQERAVLVRFSLPSAACGVVAAGAIWFCNSTLVTAKGFAELGIFTAVNNLRPVVLFLPALIGRVSLPLVNNLLANGQQWAYQRSFRATVAINGGIALLVAGLLFLGGSKTLGLFGKDFGAPPILMVMVLSSVVLDAAASTLFQALFASGRIWHNLAINTVWAAVLITFTRFTSRFGASGLAFSYLIASSSSVLLYALSAVRQCREGRESIASERDRSRGF